MADDANCRNIGHVANFHQRFALYKLPKTKPNIRNFKQLYGHEMAYYDSESRKKTWNLLRNSIYETIGNPIYNTLKPMYTERKRVAYLAYNDQVPKNFSGVRKGHSKGVLMAANDGSGSVVWLQHSVPQFVPDVRYGYAYPTSGRENGQLFLCLSMPLRFLDIIAYHLHVQAANVYQSNPLGWAREYIAFWTLLVRSYVKRGLPLRADYMLTQKRKLVLAIAKPPSWSKDIYTDELKNTVNDSIFVQSWRNGNGGAQDKSCHSKYQVTDVQTLLIHTENGQLFFSSSEDHSKWSVTRTKSVFCFSSLNRMKSQGSRGGEITCLFDVRMATLFKKSIANRTKCSNDKGE
ncbi:cell-death-related nuclease 7-like isoform X2 [Rhipicephalus microplus]|uniref:cell-death-related nuclease 7-like isoform X2 n=1 Tax=Rhipicephalus microplus TaxID=6941 RepID=UPI003F6BD719